MSPSTKLVYMANQIGKYFSSHKPADPAAGISDHLWKFWDPGMRAKIIKHLDEGGADLDPDVGAAVQLLRAKAEAKASALEGASK